jgi:anti-sigma factor RsiW
LPPLAAPDLLHGRITRSIRDDAGRRRFAPSWRGQLAAGLAIAIASSAVTMLLVRRPPVAEHLAASDVVASHVRALMSNHLTDVTSTDEHNVKPWFDGRVPFAPDVPRLDSVGFPLVGGRVDRVGDAAAAALVYGRRKHVITVFASASDGRAPVDTAATAVTERGYHAVTWRNGDMQYAAVSDLAVAELGEFVAAFRAATRPSPR